MAWLRPALPPARLFVPADQKQVARAKRRKDEIFRTFIRCKKQEIKRGN